MMPNVLKEALQISSEKAYRWVAHLALTMKENDIDSRKRRAAFLTFISHESGNLERTQVNLRGLTPRKIQALWPDEFPTIEEAQKFRGEESLANRVFAGCNGNGPYESGDGWRFRPRALIPQCGRGAYERASLGLQFDFVARPDAMAEDYWAAMVSGWYWKDEGFNEMADIGNIEGITHILAKRHLTDGRGEFDEVRVTYNEVLQVLP